jgi:hypothetical protein
MAADEEPAYEIGQMPEVNRQLRRLKKSALKSGARDLLSEAVRLAFTRLRTEPGAWGDPEYHPKKKGSTVYHAVVSPLLIHYVVFEPERKVLILSLKPLPNSPLAP